VTAERPQDVRRLSIRVALTAAALVAIAYLAVSVAVVAIVTGNLTKQIDDRLTSYLAAAAGQPVGPPIHGPTGGTGDRQFGPPTLAWRIDPDGSVTYFGPSDYATDLPASYRSIASPQTVTVSGTPVRIAGGKVDVDYVVVAQTMGNVADAQNTIVTAEILIAPVLLAIVFLGAVAIGRRVATPIDLARRRQLDFTADASHELRTPLSVIEAHTSLALAQDRSAEWYRTAFERVDNESKRMRKLLDDLLWLARFDATQSPPDTEPVDLGILAAATVDRFGVIAEARRLNLRVQIADESLVITAPAEWLDRLLGVLLDNACKYSPEGGTVTVTVGAGAASDRGRIVLAVEDSGPGIPEEDRPRIFDRFHRATESRSGAGLGLAIADAIVRATGGHWKVAASSAGGARISVTWPRSFPGPREQAAAKPASKALRSD
jgi:two-component system, OmpR family, sensor histidine kinase CiaH